MGQKVHPLVQPTRNKERSTSKVVEMYHLLEFLQGRFHKEWWAYHLVDWYCLQRGINFPRGRIHFGLILVVFTPAYVTWQCTSFFLGALLIIVAGAVWYLVKYLTMPVWSPLLWLAKRAYRRWRKFVRKGNAVVGS